VAAYAHARIHLVEETIDRAAFCERCPVGALFHFNILFDFREVPPSRRRLHTLRCLTLTGINSEHRPVVRLADRMDSFVFKCPRTRMNVQHRFADESAPDGPHCTYETVLCQACGRLHFINRSNHKLLGEPEE